jgi:hypothetical protein
VFKIQYDREAGSLCYVRMYSGALKSGAVAFNVGKKKRERPTGSSACIPISPSPWMRCAPGTSP